MATSTSAVPSLEEILSHHGLKRKDLDKECTQDIKWDIAVQIIKWKMIGHYLGVPNWMLEDIVRDNHTEEERRVQLLNTWHEIKVKKATFLELVTAFHRGRCVDLAETLCKMIRASMFTPTESQGQPSRPGEIKGRIENLEETYQDLHKRLRSEMVAGNVKVEDVMHSIALLPMKLKLEYDTSIQAKLPEMETITSIPPMFRRLNPLFTFVDYTLLQYLVSRFGSAGLKADMSHYVDDMQVFMRETTIGDMLPHWQGKKLKSRDFRELWIKVDSDHGTYTLEKLNDLRNKHSAKIKLSAVLSGIVYLSPGDSFYAVWAIPSVAVDEVALAIRSVDPTFYEAEHISMIILDSKLVYLSESTRTRINHSTTSEGSEPVCTINLSASISGSYEFPENTYLVSAVYWLHCDGRIIKPLSLDIKHCAKPENIDKLMFVKATGPGDRHSLPHTFKRVGGGLTSHDSSAIIVLNGLSGSVGIAITQEGSDDRLYIARLFYKRQNTYTYHIHLVVTWHLQAHLSVVDKSFDQHQFHLAHEQPIEFESHEIRVDIPMEGITLKEGWKITPLIPPTIKKEQVDSLLQGVPSCELSAVFVTKTETGVIPTFSSQLNLIGAKKPNNKLNITLPSSDT